MRHGVLCTQEHQATCGGVAAHTMIGQDEFQLQSERQKTNLFTIDTYLSEDSDEEGKKKPGKKENKVKRIKLGMSEPKALSKL